MTKKNMIFDHLNEQHRNRRIYHGIFLLNKIIETQFQPQWRC